MERYYFRDYWDIRKTPMFLTKTLFVKELKNSFVDDTECILLINLHGNNQTKTKSLKDLDANAQVGYFRKITEKRIELILFTSSH